MIENITLGQIQNTLGFILAFGGTIGALLVGIKKIFSNQLKPINDAIKDLDINQCKNYLVRFLSDVEQKKALDEAEIQRAYEAYEHYTNDLKKNGYIHSKWERLMKGRD